jgi:hypothetical protein
MSDPRNSPGEEQPVRSKKKLLVIGAGVGGLVLFLALDLLFPGALPTLPCVPETCSGCCTPEGKCVPVASQSEAQNGTKAEACHVCSNNREWSAEEGCHHHMTGFGDAMRDPSKR